MVLYALSRIIITIMILTWLNLRIYLSQIFPPLPFPLPWPGRPSRGEGGGEGEFQISLARILVIEILVIIWLLLLALHHDRYRAWLCIDLFSIFVIIFED
jgi:hypothetical protein